MFVGVQTLEFSLLLLAFVTEQEEKEKILAVFAHPVIL